MNIPTKPFSSSLNLFPNNLDVSNRASIGYLAAFLIIASYALYTNGPCLFFDWDGQAGAVVMDYFQQYSSSFSIAMVDPLQGMFDTYYLGYRGGLPQLLFMSALGMPGAHKTLTHLFYATALTFSVYAMGRTAGFDRKTSLLAAFLLAALTLPLFSPIGVLDVIQSISPSYTYLIAITTTVVALIWQIDGRWIRTVVFSVAIVILLLSAAWPYIYFFSLVPLIVTVMGLASLFAQDTRSVVWSKIAASGAISAAFIAAGIPIYLYDLASNSAHGFFSELQNPPFPFHLFTVAFVFNTLFAIFTLKYAWIMTSGALAAILVAITANDRKLRAFSIGYIGLVVFYGICNVAQWFWQASGSPYVGPTIYRMVHFISPFGVLFVAFSILVALRLALACCIVLITWARSQPSVTDGPMFTRRILVDVPLFIALVVPAILAVINNPGHAQKRCTLPYFSPLERNSIIDYLVPQIALSLGNKYNGSVATFTGVRRPEQFVWVDNITTDYNLWYRSGNDLRTIGLWQYRIPTLYQANMAMTPQYFLTVSEFLSQPDDKQMRLFIAITQPNQTMLSLWGVRFAISDQPLPFGLLRAEMPVSLSDPPLYSSPIRLYELAEPNLGNYSPTEIISAESASEMLARMGRSDFNGKRMVVSDGDIPGRFVPAREASMTLIEGGLLLRAESEGDSLLVLPVQYSHCWVPASNTPMTLFRANLMQLGVRFSRQLSSEIKFKFGPFWNSYCRRQDARDAERLDMVGARNRTRTRSAPALRTD